MDTVNYNNDCLFEILMRVDPADIVNCILVSKDWLEVIAGQDFRTKYLNKWKGKFVVGLLVFDKYSFVDDLIMLPITGLGRQLNDKTLIPERIGSFVSRSPNSSHMLFIHFSEKPWRTHNHYEKTLYVWTGGPTIGSPLPPPPAYYHYFAANILFDVDANSFKVIMSEYYRGKEMNTVNIQTFSSSTRRWEQSVLTCSISFTLQPCFVNGAVKTRGGVVIYWEAISRGLKCLAVWDINGGSNSVSLILEPEFPSLLRIPFYEGGEIRREQIPEPPLHFFYGTSPNGSLLSATCTPRTCYQYPSDHFFDFESWMIKIFTFDENTKDWSLLHQVRHGSIWTNNLALLSSLFGDEATLSRIFLFLSFLPGRLDSILVEFDQHIFVYYLESQKLEHLDYSKYLRNNPHAFGSHIAHHPLTLQDLGVWLSSPPSIFLEGGNRNTPCRKHPPSSTVGSLAFCLKY